MFTLFTDLCASIRTARSTHGTNTGLFLSLNYLHNEIHDKGYTLKLLFISALKDILSL